MSSRSNLEMSTTGDRPMAEKAKKVRPSVLPLSVARARQYVAQRMSQAIAESLGDGDVIDVAMELLAQESQNNA